MPGWQGCHRRLEQNSPATTRWTSASASEDYGIEGIIYTDIGRDGMGTGINIEATVRLAQPLRVPVYASGASQRRTHQTAQTA